MAYNTVCVPKKVVSGKVIWKKQVAVGHFQMGLLCPYVAQNAVPGQFIQVHVSRSYDPLLCRPLAVYRSRGDTFDILFKVVGKGTRLLSEKQIGDTVDIIGPLGSGFPMEGDFQIAMLVGGGMGIAALMSLAEAIRDRWSSSGGDFLDKAQNQIIALIGASTRSKIACEEELLALGAEVHIATEDGSAGYKGMVTELLKKMLSSYSSSEIKHRLFACGPAPMLKAIAQTTARHKVPAYVSLEERMACGIGACLGCACEVVSPEGKTQYKMVCADGPVFDAQEIVWK